MTAKSDEFAKERVSYDDTKGLVSFADYITKTARDKDVVFVCIGTDRVTGDSLGPLTGTFLEQKGYTVIGTLKNPCHATNLKDRLNEIPNNSFVIAIDGCLGKSDDIGTLSIKKGALIPGAGVDKILPLVGDLSIKAIVNMDGCMGAEMNYKLLASTRLRLVWEMSEALSSAIETAVPVYKTVTMSEVATA